jgi:hypothetical protein
MENNLENANEFLRKLDHESGAMWTEDNDRIASAFVTYAASVSPKMVMPSEDIDGYDYKVTEEGAEAFHEGYEHCLSELRRLNPTLFK